MNSQNIEARAQSAQMPISSDAAIASASIVRAGELLEAIRAVNRRVRRAGHSYQEGIPDHQVRALRVIGHEAIRPARLAQRLHVTPRAVTDVVDALVKSGLAQRAADPSDGRAQIISITSQGRDAVIRAHQQRVVAAEGIFSALSEEEQLQLQGLLNKMLNDEDGPTNLT